MSQDDHEYFMRRALTLAAAAEHRTSPNPTVGCVVVQDGQIVGEGVTLPAGQSHAEIVALNAAGDATRGARLYVTMEPCSHHGQTPPCTDAVIAAGIQTVFVGVVDPNPVVHGSGIEILRNAGIEVNAGVLEAECARHHAPFHRFIRDGRPWVILKAAITLDGCIATSKGHSQWITGEAARIDAHRLRARCDAVLVGAETARRDNPRLTVRLAEGEDPLRVVLDANGTVSPDSAVFGPGSLLCHAPDTDPGFVDSVRAAGGQVLACPRARRGLELAAILEALAARNVVSLLVEGGGRIHGSFIESGLADEGCFYLAPRLIGRGRPVLDLPSPPQVNDGWKLEETRVTELGADVRIQGRIRYPGAEGGH